jgi:hypothetical protein
VTYLDSFGLKEHPLSKEIADADLWLPSSKQAVADGLLDALTERASVVLVGEPGVGKTCVLLAIRRRVSDAGARVGHPRDGHRSGRSRGIRRRCPSPQRATPRPPTMPIAGRARIVGHQ